MFIVDGTVDPLRDVEVIGLELILADIAQVSSINIITYCIIYILTYIF